MRRSDESMQRTVVAHEESLFEVRYLFLRENLGKIIAQVAEQLRIVSIERAAYAETSADCYGCFLTNQ